MSYSVFPEVLFLLLLFWIFCFFSVKAGDNIVGQRINRIVWTVVFIIYVAVLIWAAIISRSEGYTDSVNFSPFYSYRFMLGFYNSFDVFKQIIDNILVFVPFGLLFPAACNTKRSKKGYASVILAGFLLSLTIETVQFVFSIGFAEVDDIINNTWGCIAGCGVYALADKLEKKDDGLMLKKGWLRCAAAPLSVLVIFGVIWCYREFILLNK